MDLMENMLGSWVKNVDDLAKEFSAAQPFPLVILDGFVTDEVAEGLLAEFPSIADMARSNDYMFADKRVSETLANNGPMSKRFHDLLLSDEFASILSRATGRTLFVQLVIPWRRVPPGRRRQLPGHARSTSTFIRTMTTGCAY